MYKSLNSQLYHGEKSNLKAYLKNGQVTKPVDCFVDGKPAMDFGKGNIVILSGVKSLIINNITSKNVKEYLATHIIIEKDADASNENSPDFDNVKYFVEANCLFVDNQVYKFIGTHEKADRLDNFTKEINYVSDAAKTISLDSPKRFLSSIPCLMLSAPKPATRKQTYAIYCLMGYDFRGREHCKLTMNQASAIITAANNLKKAA